MLVLVAEPGLEPRVSIDGVVHAGTGMYAAGDGAVLVLPAADGDLLWVRDSPDGRQLLRTAGELSWSDDELLARGAGPIELFDPALGEWRTLDAGVVASASAPVRAVLLAEAEAVHLPADYGFGGRRHRAPDRDAVDDLAAIFRLELPPHSADEDAVLDIDWAGDVAELRAEGRVIDDRFWDGERWTVSLVDAGIRPDEEVILHVLPLSPHSTIGLPAATRAQVGVEPLCRLDAITLRPREAWRRVALS